MNQLSDTESEQETPVVDVSIEKPKRKYTKKAKDTFEKGVTKQKAEDVPMPEPPEEPEKEPEPEQPSPVKPKRQMSEKQLQALADAREKRKAAKQVKDTFNVAQPEPKVEPKVEPKAEPKKRGRPKKVDTDTFKKGVTKSKAKVEDFGLSKGIIKEVHHHYHEPKTPKMKPTKHEQAGLNPAIPEILFV